MNKRIVNGIKRSIYYNWVKNNKYLVIISCVISALLCMLTYPGILYSDSYARIAMVPDVKHALYALLTGRELPSDFGTWFTIFPTFFILISFELVGRMELYTFTQCVLFLIVSLYFGKFISNRNKTIWSRICILCCPVILGYGVYYEASVGCVTAILIILILIWKIDEIEYLPDLIITYILLLFASAVCFGYRANAFTIIPALILIVLIKYWKNIKVITLTLTIIVGFSSTIIMPKLLNIDMQPSYAASFVWEIISTIQSMDESEQKEYDTYLDDVFWEGATQNAIECSSYSESWSNINHLFKAIASVDIAEEGRSELIIKKFLNLVTDNPQCYIETKMEFVKHTLGIEKKLNFWEYAYNRWDDYRDDDISQFDYNDSVLRETFVAYINSYMNYMKAFLMPWIMFLLVFLMLILKRFVYREEPERISIKEGAYLTSVFYYGAYLINTQSFEFRYYFPSWLILFILFCELFADFTFRKRITRICAIVVYSVVTIVSLMGGYKELKSTGTEIYANLQSNRFICSIDMDQKLNM